MAVSKRTRFEVLRRDGFTCRYCRSTEGELTVDHVVPTALGGSDDPTNLVAACRDCNAGKTSTGPDETTVADVAADAIRWAAALAKAAEIDTEQAARITAFLEWFEGVWVDRMPRWAELPDDSEWKSTVLRFNSLGISPEHLARFVDIAASANHVDQSGRWRYFCGICWNKTRELQEMARQILATEEGGQA